MESHRSIPLDELRPGARFRAEHHVTAADLAPVAAMLGEADTTVAGRAAGTLMTHLIATRFPGFQYLMQSDDFLEGPRAFAEKREPQWKGR